jgi:hypothetical protein
MNINVLLIITCFSHNAKFSGASTILLLDTLPNQMNAFFALYFVKKAIATNEDKVKIIPDFESCYVWLSHYNFGVAFVFLDLCLDVSESPANR